MTIDRSYIPAFSIETVMLDKDTGEPLSGGVVTFYRDSQRNDTKNVWQIAGTSPNYTFTQLDNPMTLSSIGTFVDSSGNPVVPYFLPYRTTADGTEVDYYYVAVESSGGVFQFDRQSVPYISDVPDSPDESKAFDNMLSNPQFVEVNFDTFSATHTYTVSGTNTFEIAPDWELVATGTGSVIVNRETPAGQLNRPTNAPYFLKFNTSGSISAIAIRQRLYQNPSIWAGKRVSAQLSGRTASSTALSIVYEDSNGASQTLISQAFAVPNSYGTITKNVQINTSTSPNEAPSGYVDIIVNLQPSIETEISSIQIAFADESILDVPYIQTPRNRQLDQLFNYYKSQLGAKPIPSWLVGWDFPLNPGQKGYVFSAGGSANQSRYTWDQTIVYQSAASGVAVSQGSDRSLALTANNATQAAIIQYLDAKSVKDLLQGKLSVNVAARASTAVNATVSLYYTTGATLPSTTATGFGSSLVATIGANGKPATFNGPASWTEIGRGQRGDAVFQIETSPESPTHNDYMFSGWEIDTKADISSATFFAIVVGTAEISAAQSVSFNSVSLCSGDFATRPAPKTFDQTLEECQYYYETSFTIGNAPQANSNGWLTSIAGGYVTNSGNAIYHTFPYPFTIVFKTLKRTTLTTSTFKIHSGSTNPGTDLVTSNINYGATKNSVESPITNWDSPIINQKSVYYPNLGTVADIRSIGPVGAASTNLVTYYINFHYIADARIGL